MAQDNPIVTVVAVEEFVNKDDTLVQSLALDVNGHEVQIIAYDHSPQVVVMVDSAVRQMHIDHIDTFIRNRT